MFSLDSGENRTAPVWGIGFNPPATRSIGAGVPRLATCWTWTPSLVVEWTTA